MSRAARQVSSSLGAAYREDVDPRRSAVGQFQFDERLRAVPEVRPDLTHGADAYVGGSERSAAIEDGGGRGLDRRGEAGHPAQVLDDHLAAEVALDGCRPPSRDRGCRSRSRRAARPRSVRIGRRRRDCTPRPDPATGPPARRPPGGPGARSRCRERRGCRPAGSRPRSSQRGLIAVERGGGRQPDRRRAATVPTGWCRRGRPGSSGAGRPVGNRPGRRTSRIRVDRTPPPGRSAPPALPGSIPDPATASIGQGPGARAAASRAPAVPSPTSGSARIRAASAHRNAAGAVAHPTTARPASTSRRASSRPRSSARTEPAGQQRLDRGDIVLGDREVARAAAHHGAAAALVERRGHVAAQHDVGVGVDALGVAELPQRSDRRGPLGAAGRLLQGRGTVVMVGSRCTASTSAAWSRSVSARSAVRSPKSTPSGREARKLRILRHRPQGLGRAAARPARSGSRRGRRWSDGCSPRRAPWPRAGSRAAGRGSRRGGAPPRSAAASAARRSTAARRSVHG